jgi:hypothetical protein
MAMNLLPILHEVRRQELHPSAEALNCLHEGLARISTAVHRLTNDHAEQRLVQFPNGEDSPIDAQSSYFSSNSRQVATLQPVLQSSEASEPALLRSLRALHQARARTVQPTRDVLAAVILRAEHEAGETSVSMIERILNELHSLDEQFLDDVKRRVPVIIQALHNLRSQETTDSVTASQLEPIVCEVDALFDLANRVQASTTTMCLHSLRSFLLVSAYRKASTLPQWLEMVEARVQTLIPMAEQWVDIGRNERTDISEILKARRTILPFLHPDARS